MKSLAAILVVLVATACGGPAKPAPSPAPAAAPTTAAPPQPAVAETDAAPPSDRPSPYLAVAGEWVGEGTQYDDHTKWRIEMQLQPDALMGNVIGTVRYPAEDCGGELMRQPEEGATLVLRERLLDGLSRCIDGGTIRLTPDLERHVLEFRYFMPATGAENASATLTPL